MSWNGDVVDVPDIDPAEFNIDPTSFWIAFAPAPEAVAAGSGEASITFACGNNPPYARVEVEIRIRRS